MDEKAPPKVIYATYTGDGQGGFIMGLPSQDMTRAEWDAADPALTKLALELKLYTLAGAAKKVVAAPTPVTPPDTAGMSSGTGGANPAYTVPAAENKP